MKTFKHGYLKIDGKLYLNYTVYIEPYYSNRRLDSLSEDTPIANTGIYDMLNDKKIDNLLDNKYVLNYGDPIHIVPDCKYAIQDIRNHYIIKRDFDSGVANIYSPLNNSRHILYANCTVIIPSRKTIIVFEREHSNDLAKSKAASIASCKTDDMIVYNDYLHFEHNNAFNKYIPLLTGTAKKPCISYKKLEFRSPELTTDVLMFVLKSGQVSMSENDAKEKYLINLGMLNQHNWRDYPKTISLLFDILRNQHVNIFKSVDNHLSKYPKYVKELHKFSGTQQFASSKDFNLSKSLLSTILNIKQDSMFVDGYELKERLYNNYLSFKDFNEVFNMTTRITPRKYEEN